MNQEINKYILGEMDSEELKAFEEKLTQDKELRQAVDDAQGTLEAIRVYQIEQTRKELLEYASQKKNRIPLRNNSIVFLGLAIAAIIIILILGPLNPFAQSPNMEEQLAQAVDEAVEIDIKSSLRNSDDPSENEYEEDILSFQEAFNSTDQTVLADELQKLEVFIQEDTNTLVNPRKKAMAFYMGAGYFKLKEYVKARAYFEQAKVGRHNDAAEEILEAPFWKEQGL